MVLWRTRSRKPRKQRKAYFQAPLHRRQKFIAAPLSEGLRKQYGTRSIQLRRGDTVLIVRGDFKGREGKVAEVDLKSGRINVEGITRTKVDGSTVYVPIHPSKVLITKLDLGDKFRKAILARKSVGG